MAENMFGGVLDVEIYDPLGASQLCAVQMDSIAVHADK